MMPEPNRFAILSEIGTGLGRIGLCSFALHEVLVFH